MKKFTSLNKLKDYANWFFGRGKFYLLIFITVIVTILFVFGVWNFYTYYVAALFSITGLLVLLNQLIHDARLFADQKPNTFRNWIMSRPTGEPLEIDVQDAIVVTSTARGYVTGSLPANATTDDRVDYLFKQLESIHEKIANVNKQIDGVNASQANKTKELNTNIENLNKSLKTLIASHPVGAYDVNLFGIVILICGTLIQLFYSLTA